MATFAIQTRNLTKRFDQKLAVNTVDLDIAVGEVYGLIGPNGAGKTTLIRLLATAESPSLGDIYINGQQLQPYQSNAGIKQQLGYLPDDFPVYDDLTVWDYLDYFARLYHLRQPHRDRRIRTVLEWVQLGHKQHELTASLSRGMKQRLGLARTLLHEPVILLLDEPVSGLDPVARVQFREIIQTLKEAGMTLLISSHVLSDLAELCTTIGIMEFGYLVESTSLEDLYSQLSEQRLLISVLGNADDLVTQLQHYPQVQQVQLFPTQNQGIRQLQARFSGDERAATKLLRSLIQSGLPICSFHCCRDDLETIFLNKLEHQQAT